MVDLNFPIEGKPAGELARYFNCSVEIILAALRANCKTYQDIQDYLRNLNDVKK